MSDKRFPVRNVFAAACAAQRINGKFVNAKGASFTDNSRIKFEKKNLPNATIMKIMLSSGDTFSKEDADNAVNIQTYFAGKMFMLLGDEDIKNVNLGKSYMRSAIKASTRIDPISLNDQDLYLISSLPYSYDVQKKRTEERNLLDDTIQQSSSFGKVGECLTLFGTVIDVVYKFRYHSYAVNFKVDSDNGKFYILFFFDASLNWVKGNKYLIRGAVKSVGSHVTQLHYVRQV